MQTDYVQRFLFENLDIRGRLVCLTGAWQRMLDGRGYPFRRGAEDLSPQSPLLAVADVFTALTETRPYRASMPEDMASRLLRRMAKSRALDPEWVSILMAHYDTMNAERSEAQAGAARLYQAFWSRVGSLAR